MTDPALAQAVSQSAGEFNAQTQAQRRNRGGRVALGAPGFIEAGNPGKRQGLGIGGSFFMPASLRPIFRRWASKKP